MAYTFNMQNTLNKEIIVRTYDWNDTSHGIAAKTYTIAAGGHTDMSHGETVVQLTVFTADNNSLLDGIQQNFYATKRNMKIVQYDGVTSIQYTC